MFEGTRKRSGLRWLHGDGAVKIGDCQGRGGRNGGYDFHQNKKGMWKRRRATEWTAKMAEVTARNVGEKA